MTKKNNYRIDAEFGVDSRYVSNEVYQSEATALMEARLQRMKKLSKNDIIRAKLLQLKLKMQAFISQSEIADTNSFLFFLQFYIDTLYAKRANFAQDIGLSAVKLSQIINGHRAPQDDFILKLMIHSEKVYKEVSDFPKTLWYQVFFHEKMLKILTTQEEWKPKLAKEVCVSEPVATYITKKETR